MQITIQTDDESVVVQLPKTVQVTLGRAVRLVAAAFGFYAPRIEETEGVVTIHKL